MISPHAVEAIECFIYGIKQFEEKEFDYFVEKFVRHCEDFDEERSERFYKKLAEQSHDHEVKAFIEEAKRRKIE